MNNWDYYVKESYDLIRRAESELTINLDDNMEAYVVMLFAHYLDKPQVNTEPLCIKLLESTTKPVKQRMPILKEVGDECLLIQSMEWGKRRWPSDHYYEDLGRTAYQTRAFIKRPPDMIYDDMAMGFDLVSQVLRHCRVSG